jgi:hypothetical protein
MPGKRGYRFVACGEQNPIPKLEFSPQFQYGFKTLLLIQYIANLHSASRISRKRRYAVLMVQDVNRNSTPAKAARDSQTWVIPADYNGACD